MRKTVVVMLVMSMTAFAEPTCQEKLDACDFALRAAEAEIDVRKRQYETLQQYARKVEEQRDRAYQQDGVSMLPSWAWVLIGAAAATVVIGVRR
jgi:hypothetical protein